MLRADQIVCGTTTTSTGTLTLAATPTPPGGIDFDVWARATGIGFGNSAAILVSYSIIEYTDSTFATAKSFEKGVGTLTLGSSSGIANATLARTTVRSTATSLNSQPATATYSAPTAFSIGTAANTLVFIGASATEIPAYTPYFEASLGDALGAPPASGGISGTGASATVGTNVDYYMPFEWRVPMLVKRASMRVNTAYTGGTPVSNAYARLYAINSSARPGKLLYDFGLLGSAGVSLNSSGNISSGAAGNGFFLPPGDYFFGFICVISGGTTGPKMQIGTGGNYINSGRIGTNLMQPFGIAQATGGTGTPAPDPANVTSYSANTGTGNVLLFTLAPS